MGLIAFPVTLENLLSWGLYTKSHLIFRAPPLADKGVGSVPCGLPYTNCLIIYHGLSGCTGNHNPCFVCKQVFLNHTRSYRICL